MTHFAVIYRPGKEWVQGTPFHLQLDVTSHRDFLHEQYDAGTLIFGGPFLDDTGGLAVFIADGADALANILTQDGSIQRALLTYEIHPYVLAFGID